MFKKKKTVKDKNVLVYIGSIYPVVLVSSIFFSFFKVNSFVFFKNFITFFNFKYTIGVLIISLVLLYLINYLIKWYYFNSYAVDYSQYIGSIFIVLLFFTFLSQNFFIFFLFLELFSYLFYFQFLQIFDKIKTKKKLIFI